MNEKKLYQEQILDHYHHPRNHGSLESPNISSGVYNPSCGDSILIEGIIADEQIIKVAFQGKGCVISQAAASMLTELAIGESIQDILTISSDHMKNLVGIDLGPTRLRCALLALEALENALKQYLKDDNA